MDLSRESEEDEEEEDKADEGRPINELEYQTMEQNLIKSLRTMRIDANKDKTKLQFELRDGVLHY